MSCFAWSVLGSTVPTCEVLVGGTGLDEMDALPGNGQKPSCFLRVPVSRA